MKKLYIYKKLVRLQPTSLEVLTSGVVYLQQNCFYKVQLKQVFTCITGSVCVSMLIIWLEENSKWLCCACSSSFTEENRSVRKLFGTRIVIFLARKYTLRPKRTDILLHLTVVLEVTNGGKKKKRPSYNEYVTHSREIRCIKDKINSKVLKLCS